MNNKPYGWVKNGEYVLYIDKPDSVFNYIPLYTHPVNPYQSITNTKIEPTVVNYTHPHPDNLGLAESIIKQQEIQIEALKAEVKQWEEWKESLNGWSKK